MTTEDRVDALIHEFDMWFQKEGKNDPLVGSERAAIKTFTWFLINVKNRSAIPVVEDGAKKEEAEASSSSVSAEPT